MTLAPGSRLGPHEILGPLGAGGMGEVYRAHDTKLNRQVAIKVLPDPYANDPERIARFQREAQAVAALNHPNIAAIYELAESGDTKFLVLELVGGETLADRIVRAPVPVDEAIGIGTQILEALEAAHDKGICHRDLKPANVKLTPDGSVKVLDFGLAKFLEAAPAAVGNLTHSPTLTLAGTFPGVILGTAGYMSPEQAKGVDADQRSDIFSFGCILYELLTGRQAFDGETASEILASVLKVDVDYGPLPTALNPRIADVLRRCLEKNRKKRYHAAADVRLDLEALRGRALVAREPSPAAASAAPPVSPWWRRALPAAAAALVAGAAVGGAAWRLKPEAARTVTRFSIRLPQDQLFTSATRRVVAMSPDGTNLAYVANARLYLRSMSSVDAHEIPGTNLGAAILEPVFSPDGQSIAFSTTLDQTLKRIDVRGGAAVTLCTIDAPSGLSWDETGILFMEAGKGIFRVAGTGGAPQLLVPIPAGQMAGGPQVLPGGKTILFSVKNDADSWDKGQIVVQPLPTGAPKVLVKGGADGRYLATGHVIYAVSGVLFAVPVDIGRGEVTGGPVPLIEGVARTGVVGRTRGEMQLAVSANGSIAYVPGPTVMVPNEGGVDIGLFDRHGSVQRLRLPPGTYRSPRVSPDGKMVTFEIEDSAGDVFVGLYDLAGTAAMRRLTFGGHNSAPVWSPDGRWIAYQSDREGDAAVYRQAADGSGTPERLTKPAAGTTYTPQSWSPDGTRLLTSVQTGGDFTLATIALADRQLSAFDSVHSVQPTEASFSPDGRWIVYQSADPSKRREVFVQPFPATGAKYLVPVGDRSMTGGGQPYWNRGGAEIIMNAAPTLSYAVAFSATPQVRFGVPEEFSRIGRTEPNPATGRRAADAMPDGEHVIGILNATAAGGDNTSSVPPIQVVINWFDELKQKVPTK